jgi:hypothetical protein
MEQRLTASKKETLYFTTTWLLNALRQSLTFSSHKDRHLTAQVVYTDVRS